DVPMPTAKRCVSPVTELIGGCSLTCNEIGKLTSRRALNFLLKRGGLTRLPQGLNDEPLAGFIYASRNFGSIFVEREDIIVRRRFSIAHEIGHYRLHFRPLLNSANNEGDWFLTESLDITEETGAEDELSLQGQVSAGEMDDLARRLPPLETMEREANCFAVELLMPEAVVREMAERQINNFLRDDDLVWRLAAEMLVSRATMRFRLRELGLLSVAQARVN
ncbi:MAG: ImmA/IrrE family metallo-endopeptidase, partial [Blastocatellia bacterium]